MSATGPDPRPTRVAPPTRADWFRPVYGLVLLLLAWAVDATTWLEEHVLQWVSDRENRR